MIHPAQLPIERLLADCEIKRTRGSGPGGQHRNKVETAVVVEHQQTGLRGEASERRSQEQNRQQAIQRLRVKLALEVRAEPAAAISAAWRQRVRGQQISVRAGHEDFPALLAESLDVLHAENYVLSRAAEKLRVTASQLVKLWKVDSRALAVVNSARQAHGESVLR